MYVSGWLTKLSILTTAWQLFVKNLPWSLSKWSETWIFYVDKGLEDVDTRVKMHQMFSPCSRNMLFVNFKDKIQCINNDTFWDKICIWVEIFQRSLIFIPKFQIKMNWSWQKWNKNKLVIKISNQKWIQTTTYIVNSSELSYSVKLTSKKSLGA